MYNAGGALYWNHLCIDEKRCESTFKLRRFIHDHVVVSAIEVVGQARWQHLDLAPLALQRLFELRSQLLGKFPKTVSDSYFP